MFKDLCAAAIECPLSFERALLVRLIRRRITWYGWFSFNIAAASIPALPSSPAAGPAACATLQLQQLYTLFGDDTKFCGRHRV